MTRGDVRGFTIVETLVAITLFSVAAAGFYSVMFSGVRASDTARSVTRISEEARFGLNRMIRDTREAAELLAPTATSYRIRVDFDATGTYPAPCTANPSGDYEDVTFGYSAATQSIRLCGELLVRGVEPVGSIPVFSYASNHLEYDANADGVTTSQELDQDAGVGNNNGVIDGDETGYVSSVDFSFRVRHGDRSAEFDSQVQLRNRR